MIYHVINNESYHIIYYIMFITFTNYNSESLLDSIRFGNIHVPEADSSIEGITGNGAFHYN